MYVGLLIWGSERDAYCVCSSRNEHENGYGTCVACLCGELRGAWESVGDLLVDAPQGLAADGHDALRRLHRHEVAQTQLLLDRFAQLGGGLAAAAPELWEGERKGGNWGSAQGAETKTVSFRRGGGGSMDSWLSGMLIVCVYVRPCPRCRRAG
jgi:hypothetical protein